MNARKARATTAKAKKQKIKEELIYAHKHIECSCKQECYSVFFARRLKKETAYTLLAEGYRVFTRVGKSASNDNWARLGTGISWE